MRRSVALSAGLVATYCSFQPVRADRHEGIADVVVIGGGIAGCSTAYFLAKARKRVVLLEKGSVGCEASSLAAGTLDFRGEGGTKRWKDFLAQGTIGIYEQVFRKYSPEVSLSRPGSLYLAANPKERAAAKRLFERYSALGHDVRFLRTAEEVEAVEPAAKGGRAVAGVIFPGGAHVDPSEATHAMAEAAVREGATLLEGQKATRIQKSSNFPSFYSVKTSSGEEYTCKQVVLCTGCHDSELTQTSFGFKLPVTPVKGQIWVTDQQPQNTLRHVIFGFGGDTAAFWREKSNEAVLPRSTTHSFNGKKSERYFQHVYARQCADGTILCGGDRIPCVGGTMDYTVDDVLVEENYRHIQSLLPGIGEKIGSYCC